LIAWSAMRASTKRRYASGSTSLSFAVHAESRAMPNG
jgi:hypothetical protein